MDMLDDLLQIVVTVAGIHAGIDKGGKIPHRAGGIERPQVDRHAELNRIEPAVPLHLLQAQKGVADHPSQIVVDAHAPLPCLCLHRLHRQCAGYHPQKGHRHPGHGGVIRFGFPAPLNMAETGVPAVAVLPFLRPGRLAAIQRTFFPRLYRVSRQL